MPKLKKYFSDHKIFYKYQSGFRTNHTYLHLNDKILKGEITGMILTDLQNVLDTIDHKIFRINWYFGVFQIQPFHIISNHICQTGLSLSMLKMLF